MSFNNFVHKNKLKKKGTSNINIYQVLSSLFLRDVGIYLRDGPFESELGKINLHPSRRTHWVLYIIHYYFDSYGCPPPKKLPTYIKRKLGKCIYSEHRVQKKIVFVLFMVYL